MLRQITQKRRARLAFLGAGILGLLAMPASAQVEVQIFPNPTVFEVSPAFSHEHDAHRNISGAACTAISTHVGCVAVNDVSNFAQSFSLSGNRIAAGTIIPLQPQQIDDLTFASVGAEGAAFDDGRFFVVGSHAQTTPPGDESNFLAFRFPPELVRPGIQLPGLLVRVERSTRLREAIGSALTGHLLGPITQARDIRLEGIAVKDGRMFLGFRAPTALSDSFLLSKAFIMSVDAAAVFSTANLNLAVREVTIGAASGIRDLARISTGILVLTGPKADQAGPASLYHFDPATDAFVKLGMIVEPADRKAEAIIVRQEDPEFICFLLLFDGSTNGGPLEYCVAR